MHHPLNDKAEKLLEYRRYI